MKKLYEKSRVWFAVLCIMIYVTVMGNLQSNFGTGSIYSVIGMLIIVSGLLFFIFKNGISERTGFRKTEISGRYLFFVPLLLLASVNLWCGVKLHYDPMHQLYAVLTMALSGIAEEVIFRGLLFRAIEEDNVKEAVIISSVTFGAGHIVNLLTGAPTFDTILQICYAIAIGFALVMVFYRSGSIIPCILTHSLINVTAEFSAEGSRAVEYAQVVFLIFVSAGYALFLMKEGKRDEE